MAKTQSEITVISSGIQIDNIYVLGLERIFTPKRNISLKLINMYLKYINLIQSDHSII
jgi:hypothetical protein